MTAAVTAASSAPPTTTGPVGRRRRSRRPQIARLVARRLAIMVPILLIVSAMVFLLGAWSPFDPLAAYLGDRFQRTSLEQREQIAQTLGLGEQWWRSWIGWWADIARGDLGHSRVYGQPVADVLTERVPWTLLLSGVALVVAVIAGASLGLLAGLRPGSWFDRLCSGFALVVQAVPPFVLSLAVITVFAIGLGAFPAGGATTPGQPATVTSVAEHLVLPALVLAISQMPWFILSVRSSVRDAMVSDAVRGAVTRGLPWRTVVRGHIAPVSLAPLVTLIGARLPEIVVGAVLVEAVFGWPGIAAAVVAAAKALDFPLLAVLTLATTALVLVGSLLADVLYLLLDPRVSVDG
ncbi:ABC transporter permease [Kribbia dieselivorans]|uniref:ABC transporter permease n=1 Tax=Kribbia dieselivorans TaxID=331526 RepID=UPI0008395C2D|nr:ABC transporter permease [Kribbia dieselivorans]